MCNSVSVARPSMWESIVNTWIPVTRVHDVKTAVPAGYGRASGVVHRPSRVPVPWVLPLVYARYPSRTRVTLRPALTVLHAISNHCTNIFALAPPVTQVSKSFLHTFQRKFKSQCRWHLKNDLTFLFLLMITILIY